MSILGRKGGHRLGESRRQWILVGICIKEPQWWGQVVAMINYDPIIDTFINISRYIDHLDNIIIWSCLQANSISRSITVMLTGCYFWQGCLQMQIIKFLRRKLENCWSRNVLWMWWVSERKLIILMLSSQLRRLKRLMLWYRHTMVLWLREEISLCRENCWLSQKNVKIVVWLIIWQKIADILPIKQLIKRWMIVRRKKLT